MKMFNKLSERENHGKAIFWARMTKNFIDLKKE